MTDRARAQRLLSAFDAAMEETFADAITSIFCHLPSYRPCTTYSLLAAPIMRAGLDDPDIRVVIGTFENKNHCWMETGDLWVLDPTHGQFDGLGLRWRVFGPYADGRDHRFQPKYVLDLDEEAHYCRTITHEGGTAIKRDFWSRPIDAVRVIER